MQVSTPYRDDFKLIQEVLAGNDEALAGFAQRMTYVARVLRARNRRTGTRFDDDELEDLVQSTVTLIWSKLKEFRGQSTLETWVYPFCVFGLNNARRKKLRHAAVIQTSHLVPDVPAQEESREVDYDHVYQALDNLSPVQSAVIRMKYLDGLTFVEISRQLSVPLDTVKTRCYRGLRELRHLLRREPGESMP